MRFSLVTAGDKDGPATSAVHDLGVYVPSGPHVTLLRLDLATLYCAGTISGMAVEGATSEKGQYTTLWSIGDPQAPNLATRILTDWPQYLRLRLTYALPAGSEDYSDPGYRVTVLGHVYGVPEWYLVRACRDEHIAAVRAILTDQMRGFGDLAAYKQAAKQTIEQALRGRGIDPYRLMTDGHPSEPCIEGLETAGAALTLYYVYTGGIAAPSDALAAMRDHAWRLYVADLDAALSAGMITADPNGDAGPPPENASRPPGVCL